MHFLFDAQMPLRLARGLETLDQENEANREIKTKISHADILLGAGAEDSQVIHKALEIDAIIFSEDSDFRKTKSNRALIKQFKLGYVLFKPPTHGSRYWEKVLAVVLAWEKLKAMIKDIDKPFLLKIDRKGNIMQEPI